MNRPEASRWGPAGDSARDEALRWHGRRLRRLARALLGDSIAAQDVAQEAFAAAFAQPTRARDLGAWLRTVARRAAGKHLREGERRRRREVEVARPEGQPATDELADRAEIVRRIGEWLHEVRLEPGRYRFTARFPDGERARVERALFGSEPGREVRVRPAEGGAGG